MRSKIKNTLPLFLAGLLLLAACTPEEPQTENMLFLDIEQPGANGSKVLLSDGSTYWNNGDLVKIIWGMGNAAVHPIRYTSSGRDAYLSETSGTTPASFPPAFRDYYIAACYPKDLILGDLDVSEPHLSNMEVFIANVRIPQEQRCIILSAGHYSAESIPLVAMKGIGSNRLYMRPIGSVIDVRLTNGFSGDVRLHIDSIVVTSNLNISGNRRLIMYPGGAEATAPEFYNGNHSQANEYKKVILKLPSAAYYSYYENIFTPGTTLNFPVALSPTDCIANAEGLPELTFHVYGFANNAPIHYTRTASLTRHLPAGAYFTAPITLDGTAVGTVDLKPYGSGGDEINSGERFGDGGSI